MNIVLKTNEDDPYLAFLNIERFPDGSGYGSEIFVRSHNFSAQIIFSFESQSMELFLSQLEAMNIKLTGSAELKPVYEDSFIKFSLDTLGHIYVRGELHQHSNFTQRLFFEFVTDQTVLSPLIKDLHKWKDI